MSDSREVSLRVRGQLTRPELMCKINRPGALTSVARPGQRAARRCEESFGDPQGQTRAARRADRGPGPRPGGGSLAAPGGGSPRSGRVAWGGGEVICSGSRLPEHISVSPSPGLRAPLLLPQRLQLLRGPPRREGRPLVGGGTGGGRGRSSRRCHGPDRWPPACDGELTTSQGVLEDADPLQQRWFYRRSSRRKPSPQVLSLGLCRDPAQLGGCQPHFTAEGLGQAT